MIYSNIKRKYNDKTKNIIKEYSRHNRRTANLKASTTFLIKCKHAGIIPHFICNTTKNTYDIFKINDIIPPNIETTLARHTHNYHMKILKLLIQQKHTQIHLSTSQLQKQKIQLERTLDVTDMLKLTECEDSLYRGQMQRNKERQIKKCNVLKEEQLKSLNIVHDTDWFVNTTEKEIPKETQWLLALGPKFALPNKTNTFPLFQVISEGEECIQTIKNKEDQEISRAKLVNIIDDHIYKFRLDARDKQLLGTVDRSRKFLNANKDTLIMSADKGGKTVAMNADTYKVKMGNILGDLCTYKRLRKDPTSGLQEKNNLIVEKLFNNKFIDNWTKNRLVNKTCMAPRIYGLPKIHKDGNPLRPICSSINSPGNALCKFMLTILGNLTKDSKYNVKDAVDFKKRLKNQTVDDDEIMVSFDVVNLFPSIPINVALDILRNKWTEIKSYTNITLDLFMEILTFCIKDTRYFKYEDKIYEQRKGMPMGSPASPIMADVVMEHLLDTTLATLNERPKILTKYVDDLFLIIKKTELDNTMKALNSFHRQLQFTVEKENDCKLPYLDTIVIRHGNTLKMNWYQKPTASGRMINFYSKHPRRTKINTANNFIRRVLQISDVEFHRENKDKIRTILQRNNFPKRTIEDLTEKAMTTTKPACEKNEAKIYKKTTYIPSFSERLKNSNIYNKDKYELALGSNLTLNQLFSRTKSKINKEEKSNVVYRIPCNGDKSDVCQKVYVGTTMNKLKTRISSHKSDHKAKQKPLEQKTALAAHCTLTGHIPNFDGVEILTEEKNYSRRLFQEMLHIIDVPMEKRLNFKRDTDGCAQVYRHTIEKFRKKIKN